MSDDTAKTEAPTEKDPGTETSRIGTEQITFGVAGILIGLVIGYTVAFQIHSDGRPGFEPPSRPNVAAMEPGNGVAGAPGGRPPFINEDGSIDMEKVPEELRERMESARTMLDQHKKMLEEDPENVDLMLTVGRFYANMGMMDKGLPYFDRAIETQPENPELRLEKGLMLFDSGRIDESAVVLQEAADVSGNDPDILTHLALAHLRMDHVDEALNILQSAADKDPQHAMSRFNIAVIHLFARQDPDEAEKALDRASSLVPEDDHRMQMMRSAIQTFRDTGQLPQLPAS